LGSVNVKEKGGVKGEEGEGKSKGRFVEGTTNRSRMEGQNDSVFQGRKSAKFEKQAHEKSRTAKQKNGQSRQKKKKTAALTGVPCRSPSNSKCGTKTENSGAQSKRVKPRNNAKKREKKTVGLQQWDRASSTS